MPGATRRRPTIDIVPLFETIDDLHRGAADAGDAARRAGLPRARRRSRRLAGGDDRLLRLEQGRRLPHLDTGRCTEAQVRAGRRGRRGRACGCACSTVAAAPSVAAAARPTRRSSPSRRAASTARCASPSRARWSPPSTPTRHRRGATSRRWSPPPSRPRLDAGARPRRRRRSLRRGDGRAVRARRSRAYRALVYDDPRFVEFFRAITPIGEISPAEHRLAARRRAPASDRIEDLRAIPWVFGWTQCRLIAARLVRRAARRSTASSPTTPAAPTLLIADVRALAVLPLDRRQHGHGAGQDRPRRSAGATPTLVDDDDAPRADHRDDRRRARTAPLTWHATDHRLDRPPRRQPGAGPQRRATASRTSIRCTSCRSRCCAATAPATHDELVARAIELTINAIATGLRNSG